MIRFSTRRPYKALKCSVLHCLSAQDWSQILLFNWNIEILYVWCSWIYTLGFNPFLSYSVGFGVWILCLETTDAPGMFIVILLTGLLLNIYQILINFRKLLFIGILFRNHRNSRGQSRRKFELHFKFELHLVILNWDLIPCYSRTTAWCFPWEWAWLRFPLSLCSRFMQWWGSLGLRSLGASWCWSSWSMVKVQSLGWRVRTCDSFYRDDFKCSPGV